jgi:excinuclease ABC subunit C
LLRGKTEDLIAELNSEMNSAASNLNFEKAAEIRDKIDQLKVYSSKQKIVTNDFIDRDIIGCASEGKDVSATILNVRNGKLVGKRQFNLTADANEELDQIYSAVIRFYYSEFVEIPKEIVVEVQPFDYDTLLEWFKQKESKEPKFIIPQRKSETKSLLEMCRQNAILQLKEIQLQRMKKEGNVPYVLAALKRDLRLKNIPNRIECFDISNLQGTDTVASMVVFVDGKPKKSEYRKFIINEVEGPNDFASMMEVIKRRYSRIVEENQTPPDLIMVDGGKGQLSSAIKILKEINLANFEIIGLAKRLEEVFLPEHSEAQTIPRTSSSLKLLQHIRDEAHRFAITFHRQRRDKRTFTTELTEIKGIGDKVAAKLLTEFENLDLIKNASLEELAKVIGKAKAELIINHYQNN